MQVAILGLGLMGASLGAALRSLGGHDVRAWARRAETREAGRRRAVADRVCDTLADACAGADLAVVCTPVGVEFELVRAAAAVLPADAVVTDVGSTKAALCRALTPALAATGHHFVGSHPMCGSDESGIEAARADLYRGATVAVTPCADSDAAAVARVEDLWRSLGSCVRRLEPDTHDAIVALTSHLPHLLAAALADQVLGSADDRSRAFCGSGFRDTTRIAGGPADVWRDIFRTNAALPAVLTAFRARLDAAAGWLDDGQWDEMEAMLDRARKLRRTLGSDGRRP